MDREPFTPRQTAVLNRFLVDNREFVELMARFSQLLKDEMIGPGHIGTILDIRLTKV